MTEVEILKIENKRLRDALNLDKTGLAEGLVKVINITRGYEWVADGRGSYAWDDDRYRDEMKHMLKTIKEISMTTLRASGALATKKLNEGLFKK